MRRILSAASAFALAAIVTAGCGGTDTPLAVPAGPATTGPPTTVPSTTVPSTTVPSTTVPSTTSPTTTAPERLSAASRLRVDGIGPIAVGMTVGEARAAAGLDLVVERLPYCDLVTAPSGPAGLSLIVSTPASGRIDLIIVKEGPVATMSGIRVGATEAEVLAAYPGRLRIVNPSLPVHRLIYEAHDAALADRVVVFVVDRERVATIYAGLRNQAEADEICA